MTNCHIYWHSTFSKCQRHVEFKAVLDNQSSSVMSLHVATKWADEVHVSFPVVLYLFYFKSCYLSLNQWKSCLDPSAVLWTAKERPYTASFLFCCIHGVVTSGWESDLIAGYSNVELLCLLQFPRELLILFLLLGINVTSFPHAVINLNTVLGRGLVAC